jgi:AraC family transcriptional regulator, transcriptional activator of pobA
MKTSVKLYETFDTTKEILIEEISDGTAFNLAKLRRHEYWEIFLFTKGSGHHLIDFEKVPVNKNSVHFILPYQIHQLTHPDEAKGLLLRVSEDFFYTSSEGHELILKLYNYQFRYKTPVLNFNEEEFTTLSEIINHMRVELVTNDAEKFAVLKNYFNIFLLKLTKKMVAPTSTGKIHSDAELVVLFRQSVEKNIQKYNKIQDYLKLMDVSAKKMSSACKLYTGISPSDYLHKRMLVEAKRLLLYSTLCPKEIAYNLNFTDLSHFVKFFKQKTGLSPKEFLTRLDKQKS